jgi:hypothetical protein
MSQKPMQQNRSPDRIAEDIQKWESMPITKAFKGFIAQEFNALKNATSSESLLLDPQVATKAARLAGMMTALNWVLTLDLTPTKKDEAVEEEIDE